MNYKEALEYIEQIPSFRKKPSLKAIDELLGYLNNPHKNLKFVHVAGTNGKGSTTAFISTILMEANYKVGIYTSPYITDFTERIKVNSHEIEKNIFAKLITELEGKISLMHKETKEIAPTYFDIITAVAFKYFSDLKCDIVVLETGLGGRFDSTNIIENNELAVITAIGLDHMSILGNTIAEISKEKAGIIKENSHVVVYPQSREILNVFKEVSEEQNCKFHIIDLTNVTVIKNVKPLENSRFNYKHLKNLEISLLGKHQILNSVVAIEAIEILNNNKYSISEKNIKDGLLKTYCKGRFEILKTSPFFVIDGAHNIQGVKALVDNIKYYFPRKKITFIVGILKDKDYKDMLQIVVPIAYKFITVTPHNHRALKGEYLASYLKEYHKNVEYMKDTKAITSIKQNDDEVICAFGSLYLISEIRGYIIG